MSIEAGLARQRSLFMMQYGADALTDRYTVADADTAVVQLGDGRLNGPIRFSFGITDNTAQADVRARVEYISSVTQAN